MDRTLRSLFRRDRHAIDRSRTGRSRRRRTAELDFLEDRTVLSATLNIAAGTLSYAAAGGAMDLSVSVDGSDVYTFQDSSQAITLGAGASSAGWTLSVDQHTATGPAASFSQIAIVGDNGAFDDVVAIQSTKAPTTLSTGAGDDDFTFNAPGITAAVTLTNALSGGGDGDAVHFQTGGVAGTFATGQKGRESYQAAGGGLINVTSVKPNFTDSFSGLSISASTLSLDLNSLYAAPTALQTTLSVVGVNIQVEVTDVPTRQFPNGSIVDVAVHGTSGGNALTIDYAGGVPYGAGVTYAPTAASGSAENALVLKNGSFTQEAYIASGPGAGSLVFPNRQVNGVTIGNQVDFANLSPITDTVTVGGFTFTASASGAQTVHIIDGPVVSGVQTTQINDAGTNHFELINFANKTNVSINTGTSGDLIGLDLTAPAAGLASVAINTGDGDDEVAVVSVPAGVAVRVDAGAGTLNDVALSNSGSLADIQGPVSVRSTGGSAILRLDDTADGSDQDFTIAPGQVTGGPLGSPVDYSGGGVTNVQVRGGSGADLFHFTEFGSATSVVTYNVDGGAGQDTLTVDTTLPANYATPGVLTFGAGQPAVHYANIEEINIAQGTAPPVGVPVAINATEAQAFVQRTVARFTDGAPGGAVNYYASIDWGDGTPASGGVIVPTGVTGSYEILGNHAYAAAASSYPVTVTLTRQGGTSTTTTVGGVTINLIAGGTTTVPIGSTASVAAAPLGAQGIPLVGRATAPLSSSPGGIQVAAFTDSGTNLDPSAYTAVIYWGDGSSSAATQITTTGTTGGVVYNVFGDHTYANVGTYPVTVLITKPPVAVAAPAVAQPPPGAQAIAVSTATVLEPPLRTVTGQLNPASDSGASSTDGITNVTQPGFFGLTDSPGASIAIVATPAGGTPFLLAATQADNAGAWNATSNAALADGSYSITVYASDRFDSTNVVTSTLTKPLVIDTVGPKVVNTVFTPKGGYVAVTYQDYGGANNAGSGVNLSTVQDPSNYTFVFISSPVKGYRPPARWLVGPITTTPGSTTGPQEAVVLINGGKAIRGGVYQLKVASASTTARGGVQDLAGNALDGDFYGTFPSGNNAGGGDFVARLDSIHNRVFAPQTVVGPGTPKTPTKKPIKVVKTPPVRKPPVKVVHTPPARKTR